MIILVLLFSLGLWFYKVYLQDNVIQSNTKNISEPVHVQQEEKVGPRFEFYSMLPNLTMENDKDVSQSTELANKTQHYIVQVASFRKMHDARFLLKSLVGLRFNPKVQNHTIDNKIWFRVCLGPYLTFNQAQQDLLSLQKQGYKAILIKTTKQS